MFNRIELRPISLCSYPRELYLHFLIRKKRKKIMHVLKLVYFFLKHFSLIFLCNYHCAAINEFKFIVLFNISHLKMWSSFRKKLYTRLKVGRYPAKYMKSLTSFSYESLKYEIFFRPRVGKILVKTSVEIENRGIGWGLKVNKKNKTNTSPRISSFQDSNTNIR